MELKYSIQDKITDGIIILEGHKCPDCNSIMEYWSMQDFENDGRIRRWWHTNNNVKCNRFWDHGN